MKAYRPANNNVVILFFTFLLYTGIPVEAQTFGGIPSGFNFKKIDSSVATVIFPQGTDSIAIQIAQDVAAIQTYFPIEQDAQFKPIPILLQPGRIISNGYVGLGPWRSEFFLMPPQDPFTLGAQSWSKLLSLHEWRHVQQYNLFNRGNSKLAGILLGQYGRAAANAAAIPDWYFEGDAVYNETRLSKQGRGRLPNFFNGYKSLSAAGKHYDFMQLRNTSFKNYIPDHYQLGYLLLLYGMEKYGETFWTPVVKEAASLKGLYPLQKALKKTTNIEYKSFVQEALQHYDKIWKQEMQQQDTIADKWIKIPVAETNNLIIDYRFPYPVQADTFVSFKTTQQDIPVFVLHNLDGYEKKIAVKDIAADEYFSYNNRHIVYAGWQPDIRWGNREFTFIKTLHIDTKEEKTIVSKTKFFSPDIAHHSNRIVAVDMVQLNQASLVLLDEKGSIEKKFSGDAGIIYSHPKFAADDASVFVMARSAAGEMALQQIDIATGSVKDLVPFANRIIGFPVVRGDTLTYTSTYNGRDAICAVVVSTGKRFALSAGPLGRYQASLINSETILTAAFTAGGYRLLKTKANWQLVSTGADTLQLLYIGNLNLQAQSISSGNSSSKTSNAEIYHKGTRLFNFHSLLPSLNIPEYTLTLYGENVLNTFQSELTYLYNSNEGYHQGAYTGIFGGSYLQPYFSASYIYNRNVLLAPDTLISWNETTGGVGLQLPLNLSKGKVYQYLTFSSSANINQRSYDDFSKTFFNSRTLFFSSNTLQYSIFSQRSRQQVLPRLGFTLLVRSRHALDVTANNFNFLTNLYLPGLLKTHSLSFNLGYQHRDTLKNYFFTNVFQFSRGYNPIDYPRMSRFGFNYQFPLFYHDWGFGQLFFLNRSRLNLFAESTKARNKRTNRLLSYKTIGAELFFDTRWFNQQDVSFGLRYSYLLNAANHNERLNVFEFILPINLYP